MIAAVLALSILGHHHNGPPKPPDRPVLDRHGDLHGWRWSVVEDRFTLKVSCTFRGHGAHVRDQVIIFSLGHGVDTTHADYRLDYGQARRISDAFHDVQKHNIFPERGWIDDRGGGEAALPLSYLKGVSNVLIRASPRAKPLSFDVSRLASVLAFVRYKGCPPSEL